MKILRIVLVAASLAALASTASLAGKDTFQTWAEGDKAYKKVWFGPAPSQMKKLATIGYPKRIGLLSYYLFDTGTHKFNAMAATYGGTYFKSMGLNERGANKFSSQFAKMGVPVLKERFSEYGMELLTPVEFLETEAQLSAYLDFELPQSGWNKFAKSVRAWLDNNPHASGAADGFEMIPTHLWMDPGILRALDELRVSRGLDGLAVVSNLTSSNPKNVIFSGATLDIFGPNPEPKPDNKMAAKYWTPSLLYVRGTFGKGFKGVEFAYWKKETIDRVEYQGYDGIIDALARRTLEELKKMHDKGK